MRLLFVTSFYPPMAGGGASRIHDFSKSLDSKGFEVTVLTFPPLRRFFKTSALATSDGIRIIRFPWVGFKHPLDQILTSFVGTLLVLAMRNPSYVIASVPPGEPAIGSYLASRILRRKIISDVRDDWENVVLKRTRRILTRRLYSLYRMLFNAIYRNSHFVFTTSPTLVQGMKERGVRTVWLIPNGADINLFQPKSSNECATVRRSLGFSVNDFVFVYAGVVGWYYRIDVVIKALQELVTKEKLSNLKLLVVGSGDRAKEYSHLAKQLGLIDHVQFLGEKPRKEVARILPCCDAGVIPYDDDPIWLYAYPTKVFEYSASGLPTIASATNGSDLEKLIVENKIGFHVDPMNVEQMSQAMLQAYQKRKRLKELGTNARKLAVEKFNRETIAARLAELLLKKS